MRYTTIGSDPSSAREVSVISLGAMRFGTTTDEATSFAILDRYAGGRVRSWSTDGTVGLLGLSNHWAWQVERARNLATAAGSARADVLAVSPHVSALRTDIPELRFSQDGDVARTPTGRSSATCAPSRADPR